MAWEKKDGSKASRGQSCFRCLLLVYLGVATKAPAEYLWWAGFARQGTNERGRFDFVKGWEAT